MKFRDLIRLIEKDGWYWKRTSGSHRVYKHPTKQGSVIVAYHGTKDVPEGTVRSILKQAEIN